ncbi:MAG: hypothetical protein ABSF45_09755 [Terriglobia bacterium]|jgi:hypothetical protein
MNESTRRKFLREAGLTLGSAAIVSRSSTLARASSMAEIGLENQDSSPGDQSPAAAIDFRYSPLSWQTVYCFPDDPFKSLVGDHGDLRYWNPGRPAGAQYFPQIVEFSLLGMESDQVGTQRLESPGIPIIHTRIDRPEAFLELTTFATRRPAEGRVDNVILEVRPRMAGALTAVPLVLLKTRREAKLQTNSGVTVLRLDDEKAPPFLVTDAPLTVRQVGMVEREYRMRAAVISEGKPFRCFLRLPQEGQEVDKVLEGLTKPQQLLAEVREYWQNWKPCEGQVSFQIPGPQGDFLVASARNIQQAREEKAGKLAFEVGPTVYRTVAIVDGHFLLEAARYLGYDAAAQQGLEITWNHQEADGGVFAAAGHAHWKDTGIALFTLVRQAELSQDWSYFRAMQPQVVQAVKFLVSLREKARSDGSINGRYGLLAPGYGDGGLGGIHSEFTNTVWVLAGLKAVVEAADKLGLADPGGAKQFYQELRAAFLAAARQEMRRHPEGFDYLPMLAKEDPLWSAPDEWDRPRPQTGQWALSHAIYPGLVFDKDDPIVQGHIRLMQSCTQEDIPAETGWLPHGGLWPYNGAFVAHVYLWAGLADWARRTFSGFLNHASPLYCWWEEQPVRGSLTADLHADMPHNWASAECILYLRHMLALEDGQDLRLLAGIGDSELASGEPLAWLHSPTRFGRIDVSLEPLDRHAGWRFKFQRGAGPAPANVQLPSTLASGWRFAKITGAEVRRQGNVLMVTPTAASWEAVWRA